MGRIHCYTLSQKDQKLNLYLTTNHSRNKIGGKAPPRNCPVYTRVTGLCDVAPLDTTGAEFSGIFSSAEP